MSAQLQRARRSTRHSYRRSIALERELEDHLQRYSASHGVSIPTFDFLNSLPPEVSLDSRSRFLRALLPKTELQLDHFLDSDSAFDDMDVTFPNFDLFDTNVHARLDARLFEQHPKTTWKQFCDSTVHSVFMKHIDTVTFSMRMKKPSRMYVTTKFDGDGPLLDMGFEGFRLGDAYDRLDDEYIEIEFDELVIRWKEAWKPAAMTPEVIETMAADLRKMYKEMRW
ncbi:unnamed protein product [Aureobasidium mustum]|uniref:Uncharacterized protein n=1 Tax=Aureobasidium mustum TaxID=2773714 RepID=A0A9N8PDU1_9PEZI|nr:unnamed protein product [Aureobasidium mustum]